MKGSSSMITRHAEQVRRADERQVSAPRPTRETDRLDAYAPCEETAAAPCQTAAAIPMAVPPGMGLGVRHLGRAVAALPPGAALPHGQPHLPPDALPLATRPAP